MKGRYWVLALVLFALVFGVEYDLARRTGVKVMTARKKTVLVPDVSAVQPEPAPEPMIASSANMSGNKAVMPPSFDQYFLAESRQIANLQSSPAEIEKRLDHLAETMTSADVHQLSSIMQDTNRGGDERSLAVEVLSRKKSPEALKALENFVKSHQSTTKENWSRAQEFESVMRAQAVEGIAAYPQKEAALSVLNDLSQRVDESFLLDRIARSSESVKGNAPAPAQQDDAALRKLIE